MTTCVTWIKLIEFNINFMYSIKNHTLNRNFSYYGNFRGLLKKNSII